MFKNTTKQYKQIPEDDYVLARLKNITSSAEGTNLPPNLNGNVRVPIVTGLKLVRSIVFASGDHIQYIITWNDVPINNVDHYNLYVNNTGDPKGVVSSPFSVKNSPAFVLTIVSPNSNSRNIITVQTVLNNGLISSIDDSPSVIGGFVNFP